MSATLDDPRIAGGMRRQMELRKRRLNEGAHQIGWKVGFGAPAAGFGEVAANTEEPAIF